MDETVRLVCTVAYRNAARGLAYRSGEVIEVPGSLAAWLMRDAPGVFLPELAGPAVEPARKRARGLNRAVLEPVVEK